MTRHVLLLGLMVMPAVPAPAQAVPDVVTLSPGDREAALEAGAAHAAAEPPINGLSRGVHGEIGTEIGSNGSHAIFGTARVPLGDNGAASVSFLDARSSIHPR